MTTHNSLELAKKMRKQIVTMAYHKKASHIGGALSITDVLAVLYSGVLNYNPAEAKSISRDRLFYSKGHACTALYSVLQQTGFYSEKELMTFTDNGSLFTSHVNHKIPGIELSTGSLGHALSVACGVALSGKLNDKPWKVYCILSDGELDEGSNWEAILFAPHHQLTNLTLIIDYNKIQSLGETNQVLNLEPLKDKFTAFGWAVLDINGHDHQEIKEAFQKNTSSPKVIIAHTIKGKGVDFMESKLLWHYKSPSEQEYQSALTQIDAL